MSMEPKIIRTTHPWLHPTKGWRHFARPAGTNRRRRLIFQGQLMVLKDFRTVREVRIKNQFPGNHGRA